jgi:hypothetical protein
LNATRDDPIAPLDRATVERSAFRATSLLRQRNLFSPCSNPREIREQFLAYNHLIWMNRELILEQPKAVQLNQIEWNASDTRKIASIQHSR